MMDRPLDTAVALYKALAHPSRLRILAMLRGGELCVCQITAVLGVAASTVSAHLAELRRAGLISERKAGRWVHYGLAAEAAAGPHIAAALGALAGDPEIAADAAVLERLRRVPVEEICRVDLDLAQLGITRTRR